ncbi:MAG: hypothetical protein ACK5U8_22260, partial [Deltaproteobacteria bacterium]
MASTRLSSLRLALACALAFAGAGLGSSTVAHAQAAGGSEAQEDEEALDEEDEEAPGEATPRLRPPDTSFTAGETEGDASEDSLGDEAAGDEASEDDEAAEASEDDAELPDPERSAARLEGAGTDPTVAPWTTPQTVFELHGYMRMRGEFVDQLFLGRGRVAGSDINDFFS